MNHESDWHRGGTHPQPFERAAASAARAFVLLLSLLLRDDLFAQLDDLLELVVVFTDGPIDPGFLVSGFLRVGNLASPSGIAIEAAPALGRADCEIVWIHLPTYTRARLNHGILRHAVDGTAKHIALLVAPLGATELEIKDARGTHQ